MAVEPRFDPVVHAPVRLRLCAMLAALDEADFSALRDALELSDSVLSKQLKVLAEAGYLVLTRATVASRVRTRVALTRAGRQAYAAHVAELQRLVSADHAAALQRPR
jgi:DNA-binding MarR family transcriptional regulator